MKQTRGTSLLKSVVSTAVGFGVAFVANAIILPHFGLPISHSANLLLTSIYTVISIARGYALERIFEAMGWRTRMSAFAMAVLAERQGQISREGYDAHHDDEHDPGDLSLSGAAYAVAATTHVVVPSVAQRFAETARKVWQFNEPMKLYGFRRDLIRACALIIAEGERFDRQRKSSRRSIAVASEPQPRGA